jgi:exonuclease SbcD
VDEVGMKVVHLADTHLGYRQLRATDEDGRNQRERDVYEAFGRAIDRIIELAPTAVVHAGDLFDGYHPSSAALGVALDGIAELHRARIPFVVIAGNHSTPRFASAEHVFAILDRFEGAEAVWREPRTVRIGDLAVHAIPHQREPESLVEQLRAAAPDPDARFNVLAAHLGLEGLPSVGSGESNAISLSGRDVEQAAGFDYIALGHLHIYAGVRENAAYSGSLERLNWHDTADKKGILEVNLEVDPWSDDFLVFHELPARARIELDPIDASQVPDLNAAIAQAAQADGLDRAIVRLPIDNATPADIAAIDRRAFESAFAHCLHAEINADVLPAPSGSSPAPRELREFLLAAKPDKVDADEFIARAEAYLARADEEMAE